MICAPRKWAHVINSDPASIQDGSPVNKLKPLYSDQIYEYKEATEDSTAWLQKCELKFKSLSGESQQTKNLLRKSETLSALTDSAREAILNKKEELCIYFTGHSVKGTGDWVTSEKG